MKLNVTPSGTHILLQNLFHIFIDIIVSLVKILIASKYSKIILLIYTKIYSVPSHKDHRFRQLSEVPWRNYIYINDLTDYWTLPKQKPMFEETRKILGHEKKMSLAKIRVFNLIFFSLLYK